MRKIFFALLAALVSTGVMTAATYDFDVLTIERIDGTTCSLSLDGLECSFADNMLVAHNFTDNQSFEVADLAKMYFGKSTQGVDVPVIAPANGVVEVYGICGSYLGTFSGADEARSALDAGIYILRSEGLTTKLIKR